MLSLSADISNSDVDLHMVNGEETGTASDIEHGQALMRFAEAVASPDEEALPVARENLLQEAGAQVLVDAAAVAANFQRMVRIADTTGIPLDDISAAMSRNVASELDLRRFETAQHTPIGGLKQKLMAPFARRLALRLFRSAPD